MEKAENRVAETFGVYIEPFVELVRREGVVVNCLLKRGVSIYAFTANFLEQFINFVWNSVVRSSKRKLVYLFLDFETLCFIGSGPKLVVAAANAVEVKLLFLPVDGSNFVGSLEHHMLKVVGNTGCIFRVVYASGFNNNSTKHLGGSVVFVKEYGKPVAELMRGNFKWALGHSGLLTNYEKCQHRYSR